MLHATGRRILAGVAGGLVAMVIAPAASASIAPALTLDQSAGTTAGSTVNLGMDLKFAPSGGDSPKDLSLSLPAGLLADASINGGKCLSSPTPTAACQVGSGTATASPVVGGVPLPTPVSVPLAFDLVAPPKPGDLAGLAILATFLGNTSQLGSPGDVTVRSSSDPAGVGLNIGFANVPDTFAILGPVASQIAVDELSTTFNGLRMPASCPAAPASVNVTADSYAAPTTKDSASAPLHVTNCSSLPFTPAFHVTVVKNSADSGVQITTDITQPAKPVQATNRTVALTLPPTVLWPNLQAVLHGGILCANPSSGTCKPVGTASSTSPLYPTPLLGKDYLTGSLAAPAIAIVFPAPFALTLYGTDDLGTSTTTFANIPDIPLTDLKVVLAGGPNAVFRASCAPPSGIATSTLTSQSGDRAVVSSRFTVSGCPGSATAKSRSSARPRIGMASLSGLTRGKPALSVRIVSGNAGHKLSSFTIELPSGLSFLRHRLHHRLTLTGVSVEGAKVKSEALKQGHLFVSLSRPVSSLVVRIRAQALHPSTGLERRVKRGQFAGLKLTVLITDSAGQRTTVTRLITKG